MIKKKNDLSKMRSYSSVFSSTYFAKLIKYDDYSFINSRIIQFDKSMIGKKITTYYEYLKYIYSELRKQYRNEYIYKNTFINELLLKSYGVRNTLAINEFRVCNSIADIVMFNGVSKAFEIKTELDSNIRLDSQLTDYKKIFNECYIITHESLLSKYLKNDLCIGIILLTETPRSLKMEEVRPAIYKEEIDSGTVMRTLRTNEYKNIVKQHYGYLPEMNSFNMFNICSNLINKIPSEKLNSLFICELKKRKSNTSIIRNFCKELRQLALAMNIDSGTYQQLYYKLNKEIRV